MKVHAGYYQYMDRIVELCNQHNIKLSFFISPYHTYTIYPYWSIGGWDVWEDWKSRLAEYRNVYDFSRYNMITDETVSEKMSYWYEQYHFNPPLGEEIVNILIGN